MNRAAVLHLAAYPLISLVILFMILSQAVASFNLVQAWPFLAYHMYHKARYEGDLIERYALVGILLDSTEVPILAEHLGLSFWLFLQGPVAALRDSDTAKLRLYAEIYLQRTGRRLAALRLEDYPIVLTRDGMQAGPTRIVNTMAVDR